MKTIRLSQLAIALSVFGIDPQGIIDDVSEGSGVHAGIDYGREITNEVRDAKAQAVKTPYAGVNWGTDAPEPQTIRDRLEAIVRNLHEANDRLDNANERIDPRPTDGTGIAAPAPFGVLGLLNEAERLSARAAGVAADLARGI